MADRGVLLGDLPQTGSSAPANGVLLAAEAGPMPERRSGTASPVPTQPAAGLLPAMQSLLYVTIAGLFLTTFTVQPIRIPSESMEPTLLVGDFLLLDKQSIARDPQGLMPPTGIARGDVVVFHDPVGDPAVHLVKRVVALPGDRLHLRDGVVYRNGQPLVEPYAVYRQSQPDAYRDDFPSLNLMDPRVDPAWWITLRRLAHEGEITVPAGDYFVLGDNRNDSEDSRYWGFVRQADIVGKPILIYFSWPTAGQPGPSQRDGRLDFARWDRTFRVVR